MNTAPVLVFPRSPGSQVEPGGVRPGRPSPIPGSGSDSTGEIGPSQNAPATASAPQDEVKVQWDNSDQTVIYQFVNQHGSLILQVPSEQLLNIAHDISQELAQAAPKASAGNQGGTK
jgi:hypothetical protein